MVIESADEVVVVEPGLGLFDLLAPFRRLRLPGWLVLHRRKPQRTFRHALTDLGIDPGRVTDIVLSHVAADRLGSLSDFPLATVHAIPTPQVTALFSDGGPRKPQVAHSPRYAPPSAERSVWRGFVAYRLAIESAELHLVELPGHALGHAGILFRWGAFEVLHTGCAIASLAELVAPRPPTDAEQWLRVLRDSHPFERLATRDRLRALVQYDHQNLTLVAAQGEPRLLSIGSGPHPHFE